MDELKIIRAGKGPWACMAQKRVRFTDGGEMTVYFEGRGATRELAFLRLDRLVLQFLSDPGKWL